MLLENRVSGGLPVIYMPYLHIAIGNSITQSALQCMSLFFERHQNMSHSFLPVLPFHKIDTYQSKIDLGRWNHLTWDGSDFS